MPAVFLHGALRHLPLLAIVLDQPLDTLRLNGGDLRDHRVAAAPSGGLPALTRRPGAACHGVVLTDVSEKQRERLAFYAGVTIAAWTPVVLMDGQSALALLSDTADDAAQDWRLEDQSAVSLAIACHAAAEIMGYFGSRSRAAVAGMMPMIRSRAASKQRAAHSLHGAHTKHGVVDVRARHRAYAHFFALDDFEIVHERFDGALSEPLSRAVFIATDAAILLPYDPVRDRVLLVEQMRMGPVARGDRACWQLEPIAGHIDPGESPAQAARREAMEEAGLSLQGLEEVAQVYASPGNSTEFYYIFCGVADLPDTAAGQGGLASEHEDIRSHLMGFEALMTLVKDLQAANAPLVLASYWLAANRDRLRAGA